MWQSVHPHIRLSPLPPTEPELMIRATNPLSAKNRHFIPILAIVFAIVLGGCQPAAEVTSYEAPKEETPPPVAPVVQESPKNDQGSAQQMLVAFVEHQTKVWFLKLLGPTQAVSERKEKFQDLIESLSFDENGPQWTLPSGWREQPGSGMRYATINAGQPGLDVSVIGLPSPQPLLANVNRWRGQLQLSHISQKELEDSTQKVELADAKTVAFVFDLEGIGSATPRRGPFAAGPPPAVSRSASTSPVATASPGFEYEKPDGWQPGKKGPMRKIAFEVSSGDLKAEITVTTLPAGGGAVGMNVDRWRGQVGLPPVDAADEEDGLDELDVSGQKATYVVLEGPEESDPRRSTLGVISIRGDTAWFFKMMGDAEVVSAQKENFESFVGSVRFPN